MIITMSLLSKMRLARKEESGPSWFWSFMSCTIVIKDDNVKQWMLVDINNGWQNLDKNNIAGNWVAGHEGLGQVDRVWTSSLFWCSATKVVLTINYKLILEVILISVFKINSKNLLSSTLPKIQDQHSNQGGSVCRGEQPWREEQGRQQWLQHQGRRVQVFEMMWAILPIRPLLIVNDNAYGG